MGVNAGKEPVPRASIPLDPPFGWSVGNWMENFFDGLKQGKFLASKCPVCGRVYLPPRMICERCFARNEEWVELPASGTVKTYTRASVSVSDTGELVDLAAPETIAMVQHDGADTCIAARLQGDDPFIGMRVEAVLDPAADKVIDVLASYRPLG